MLTLDIIKEYTKGTRDSVKYFKSIIHKNPGISANDVLRQAHGLGLKFRRGDALDAVKRLKNIVAGKPYVKSVRLNRVLDITKLPIAEFPTLRDYSFEVRVRGIHPDTGEKVVRYFTASSNTLLTKQQAIDQVRSYAKTPGGSKELDNQQWHTTNALLSPASVYAQ